MESQEHLDGRRWRTGADDQHVYGNLAPGEGTVHRRQVGNQQRHQDQTDRCLREGQQRLGQRIPSSEAKRKQ
jgi:hypothetical protein